MIREPQGATERAAVARTAVPRQRSALHRENATAQLLRWVTRRAHRDGIDIARARRRVAGRLVARLVPPRPAAGG